MANEKISAMTALAGADATTADQIPIVNGGVNKSITVAQWQLVPVTQIVAAGGNFAINDDGSAGFGGTNFAINSSGAITKAASISTDGGSLNSDGSGHLTAVSFIGSGASLTGLVAAAFANQSANVALVGPASGSAATPTFRALVNADLPLGNATVYAVTAANRTTVNGTLTAVADLSIALLAGATYEFEAHLSVAASAVTGNQYGVNFSAAGSTVEAQITGTLAAASAQAGRISAIATASATFDTAGADGAIVIKGVIVTTSNAGNLTIQHLAVVATTTTATVYKNSVLKATRIA